MLTKTDLKQIDQLLQKRFNTTDKGVQKQIVDLGNQTQNSIQELDKSLRKHLQDTLSEAFRDFYENILEPYFSRNEKDHEEIKEHLEEDLRDHDKRISKLEALQRSN